MEEYEKLLRKILGSFDLEKPGEIDHAYEACVDYARREAGIVAYVTLTGDPDADIATIARHYAGRSGKRPELASPVRWLE